MFKSRVVWSPVEEEWLRKNKHYPINQMTQALSKSRYAINKKLAEMKGRKTSTKIKKKVISKIGRRKDCDNMFLRSAWEANVYRYLKRDESIKFIEVEPTTFSFAPFGILKGTVSYTPDFKVTFVGGGYMWVEVKGYLKKTDQTKIRRFKKFFPKEFSNMFFIAGSPGTAASKFFTELGVPSLIYYNDLKKRFSKEIPGWE
jgi:hypothetical protein